MFNANWSIRWRHAVSLPLAIALGVVSLVALATPSGAAGETGLITISPTAPSPQPSGAPTTYSIAVSCEGTAGTSCGGASDSTITIPLTGTNTVPADMSTWAYSAVSGTPGLIDSGPSVVANGTGGFNLVLDLNANTFASGYSGTITLQVTPPDNTTPNHTTWSLLPTLERCEHCGDARTDRRQRRSDGNSLARHHQVHRRRGQRLRRR